jgi:serine/threonine-protein kinase
VVEVFFSKGSATVTMPNVVNLDSTTAAATLGKAGFNVSTVNEANDSVPIGKVIRTDPAANSDVPAESSVTMYVSSGKAQVEVPDVVGKTEQEAKNILLSAGFGVVISAVPSTPADDKKVLSQNPAGGTMVNKSPATSVTIKVGDKTL